MMLPTPYITTWNSPNSRLSEGSDVDDTFPGSVFIDGRPSPLLPKALSVMRPRQCDDFHSLGGDGVESRPIPEEEHDANGRDDRGSDGDRPPQHSGHEDTPGRQGPFHAKRDDPFRAAIQADSRPIPPARYPSRAIPMRTASGTTIGFRIFAWT